MKKIRKITAGQTTSLPPPAEGRIFKQNPEKLCCSIQAVIQVVYVPACFWEGGARCFVEKFSFRHRMVPEAGAFFGRRMTWNIIFRERYKRFVTYAVRIAADCCPPTKSD